MQTVILARYQSWTTQWREQNTEPMNFLTATLIKIQNSDHIGNHLLLVNVGLWQPVLVSHPLSRQSSPPWLVEPVHNSKLITLTHIREFRISIFNSFYWGPQGHHFYCCRGLPFLIRFIEGHKVITIITVKGYPLKIKCIVLHCILLNWNLKPTQDLIADVTGAVDIIWLFSTRSRIAEKCYTLKKNVRCLWELPYSFSNWSIFSTSPHSKKLTLVMKHSISLEHWTSIWLCEIPLDQ